MNSPTALATCIVGRLEDDIPSVLAWLDELAQADLEPAVASKAAELGTAISKVMAAASELAVLVGAGEKTADPDPES